MSKQDLPGPSLEPIEINAVEPPPASVERMWSRLAESTARPAPFARQRGGRMQLAALGALSTFVLGVWVGRGSVADVQAPRLVSAEPLAFSGSARANRQGVQTLAASGTSEQQSVDAEESSLSELPVVAAMRQAIASERAEEVPPISKRPATGAALDGDLVISESVSKRRPLTAFVATPASVSSSSTATLPVETDAPLVAAGGAAPGVAPRWRLLASTGDYEAALFELSRSGGFDNAFATADADGLLLLADVARATGQPSRAIAALRRLLRGHLGSGNAPVAAWSLGNLLEKAGDRAGAAQAFATYQALSPGGDFAEDAHIRRVRAAIAGLDKPRAERLAADYRRQYPKGKYLKALSGWFEATQWQAAGEPSDPASKSREAVPGAQGVEATVGQDAGAGGVPSEQAPGAGDDSSAKKERTERAEGSEGEVTEQPPSGDEPVVEGRPSASSAAPDQQRAGSKPDVPREPGAAEAQPPTQPKR